jgi:hypothetical protein
VEFVRLLPHPNPGWSAGKALPSTPATPAIRRADTATFAQATPNGQTVATGVAGEPTAPGSLSGGPVNRKRLRPFARSQSARGVR